MKYFAFGKRKSMHSRFGYVAPYAAALCGALIVASLGMAAQEKDKSGVNVTVTGKDGSDVGGLIISAQATAKGSRGCRCIRAQSRTRTRKTIPPARNWDCGELHSASS